jgi:hypothetical protein
MLQDELDKLVRQGNARRIQTKLPQNRNCQANTITHAC